jgi:hypothetical protein
LSWSACRVPTNEKFNIQLDDSVPNLPSSPTGGRLYDMPLYVCGSQMPSIATVVSRKAWVIDFVKSTHKLISVLYACPAMPNEPYTRSFGLDASRRRVDTNMAVRGRDRVPSSQYSCRSPSRLGTERVNKGPPRRSAALPQSNSFTILRRRSIAASWSSLPDTGLSMSSAYDPASR